MTIEYDQPNGGNSGADSEQRENNGRSGTSRQSNGEDDTSDLTNKAGDPGRTPGSAEGVEDFDKTGNE